MKRRIITLILIICCLNIFSADIRNVNKTAGLKKLKIGISLNKTEKILEQYRIRISSSDVLRQETALDPYKILKKNIYRKYKKLIKDDIIVITEKVRELNRRLSRIRSERRVDYFIDLLNTTLDKKMYFFYNKNRAFFLQYKYLKKIDINSALVNNINSLLINVSIYFYANRIYRIKYKASLNLDQLYRFIENYKQRFRINHIGNGLNVFYQSPYKYNLKIPDKVTTLLRNIDRYRMNEKKYKNHVIEMDMYDTKIKLKARLYKARCYRQFVRDIIVKTIVMINDAKRAIQTTNRLNNAYKNRRHVRSHNNVDDL